MYGIEYRKYKNNKIIEKSISSQFNTKEEADIALASFGMKEGAYPSFNTKYESHKILVSPHGPVGYFDVKPYGENGVRMYKRTLLPSYQVIKID